jgi:hypothetical protein
MGSILRRIWDKINDDTPDPYFVKLHDEAMKELEDWAISNGYEIHEKIPGSIETLVQECPYLKCDEPIFDFIITREVEKKMMWSFLMERRFDNPLGSGRDTSDALVSMVKYDLGADWFTMDRDRSTPFVKEEPYLKWKGTYGPDLHRIWGEPKSFLKSFFTKSMEEHFKEFMDVKFHYVNGWMFLIRHHAAWSQTEDPVYVGMDSSQRIGVHRRWDKNSREWLGGIIRIREGYL